MITITIDDKLGSKFQEEVAIASLLGFLIQWKEAINSKHKGNHVDYKIETK